MPRTAKLFMNGRSQAVRLPAEFRFPGREVHIRKDEATGDVILSPRPQTFQRLAELVEQLGPAPDDFLATRDQTPPNSRFQL